jgi:hypothetical protein
MSDNERSNTRTICVLLVIGNIVIDCIFGHFSFDRREHLVKAATFAYLACMLAIPITLWFLKGARGWRWSVFALWLL